ncbi:PepSY domain-containing protein [Streptomyces sp. NBC_00536]|uniref:PepSY domain-containing protein n=1 Tax=Streptomyces sp. NBC_00536 TaxID=2975769 RepID=UPI002E81033C|nr:PepSY domain-containing protein [Streptomyces sp. NBC_00536]WUC81347.1 PepSY domain-containing protein [Streptomyces sp. NBC_00536]
MKRNLFVSSAAAVVLMAGGPVAAAAAQTTGDAARAGAAVTAVPADVSAETAATAALKHFPGVVESLDKDGSIWHVNVIGKNGASHAELQVDVASGAVTQPNSADKNDNGNEYAPLIAAKVTAVRAMKAAVAAHAGQVRSVSWDSDDDNGSTKRYWNVEIKTSGGGTQNVHVDPTSGKVLSSNSDNGDGGNDENSDGGS